jgi:L-aminopeptidase/D-esterase-like protein
MSGDGDTVFALATGAHPRLSGEEAIAGIEDRLRAAAMRAMVGAILSSIEHATGLGGVPSAAEHAASFGPEANS